MTMKRKIISIDETKCNGCGACIPDCPEGALQLIDGKARLVSDLFCDGLGACIGICPEGAISTVEREAEAYDEGRVMRENIIPKGANTIRAHLKHLMDHKQGEYYRDAVAVLKEHGLEVPSFAGADGGGGCPSSGCPGMAMKSFERAVKGEKVSAAATGEVSSAISNWPVELRLVNPDAPFFKGADLLVAADCTAFAYGNFHRELLEGRKLMVFCPKLDGCADEYVEKLAAVFSRGGVKSVTVVRMEVPCCGGTTAIVQEALDKAGVDIPMDVCIVGVDGELRKRAWEGGR